MRESNSGKKGRSTGVRLVAWILFAAMVVTSLPAMPAEAAGITEEVVEEAAAVDVVQSDTGEADGVVSSEDAITDGVESSEGAVSGEQTGGSSAAAHVQIISADQEGITEDTYDNDLSTGPKPDRSVSFEKKTKIDGVVITVSAEAGVFPAGARLKVSRLDEKTANLSASTRLWIRFVKKEPTSAPHIPSISGSKIWTEMS